MSRVGIAPINIPDGVSVKYDSGKILIKSSKLEKEFELNSNIECRVVKNNLLLLVNKNKNNYKNIKPIWGTFRSNINNIINGIINGFHIDLEINGIGYKADINGEYLNLNLGYSHAVKYKIPNDVNIKCVKPVYLIVSGIDKQKVCAIASDICKIRKYDPYKGKGIMIKGSFVLRKVVSKKK